MKLPVTPVVLSVDEVLSRRHAPSMLGLALAAGAVNVGAFVVCQRYVTHVTGTVTRIGLDFGQWFLVFEYSLVLAAFIAGAMTSVMAVQRRAVRGLRPRPDLALFGAAAVLALTALAGGSGLFGISASGTVEQVGDFVFLSVLAFAMGLMNATVASSTAVAIRTTHMTGPASDFGVSLASALFQRGEARQLSLRLAALRGGKLVAFVVGAALMLPLVENAGFNAFLVPAAFISLAALRSFVPATAQEPVAKTTLASQHAR